MGWKRRRDLEVRDTELRQMEGGADSEGEEEGKEEVDLSSMQELSLEEVLALVEDDDDKAFDKEEWLKPRKKFNLDAMFTQVQKTE